MSLYRPLSVSLVWPPSMVSAKMIDENPVVLETSTAYESTCGLSSSGRHRTNSVTFVVSWPSRGCAGLLSATNLISAVSTFVSDAELWSV